MGKKAEQDCWAEVYVENLSSQAVWFDDLEIATGALPTALVVQEAHYDPWGLELAGIGYNASGNPEHRWKFQEQESMGDWGLNWIDFVWRQYDPALGRANSVDPLADENETESPWCFLGNDPVDNVDPDGMDWYKNNETGAVVWRAGDAKSVDIDGDKYESVGANYQQTLEDGSVVSYQQDKVTGITPAEKATAGQALGSKEGVEQFFGKDFVVTVEPVRGDREINQEIKNFSLSLIPPTVRDGTGIKVDETKTVWPAIVPVSSTARGGGANRSFTRGTTTSQEQGRPSSSFAHGPKAQSTGKLKGAKLTKHQKGENRDDSYRLDRKRDPKKGWKPNPNSTNAQKRAGKKK